MGSHDIRKPDPGLREGVIQDGQALPRDGPTNVILRGRHELFWSYITSGIQGMCTLRAALTQ